MSLDDATCSYDVECLFFPVMSDMSFVPMFRWSSLVDHVPPFFCFFHWLFGFISSGVGWFTCPAFLLFDLWRGIFFSSALLMFFPRCYQRSIVIISLVFYFLEIKQLFPLIGSSPSDITGPGYGRPFVQASLDIADRPIHHPSRHSAYVIHGGSSLSDSPFSREPRRFHCAELTMGEKKRGVVFKPCFWHLRERLFFAFWLMHVRCS